VKIRRKNKEKPREKKCREGTAPVNPEAETDCKTQAHVMGLYFPRKNT
jgi:hypothetical protein